MKKNIALLGSTGSIGRQTLEVIEALGTDYRVAVLAAGSSDELLAAQVAQHKPDLAVLYDDRAAERLAERKLNCRVAAGREGLMEAAAFPGVDLVVMAQVGFSGFAPLMAALEEGKMVALANKESLVVGGELLKSRGMLEKEQIIPVDSEHSAVWQCLQGTRRQDLKRVVLTASGGPFWGWSLEQLSLVTPDQALRHPNWEMGAKITIDSATMMNKGLEVMEARWLFDLDPSQVAVIVHRQSIVHSLVEFTDGTFLAQMGPPDMRLPIQYALTYPERRYSPVPPLDLHGLELTFAAPEGEHFPCLDLAYKAMRLGGTAPAVLNAANEVAVASFLGGEIAFTAIPAVIAEALERVTVVGSPSLEAIIAADEAGRQEAAAVLTDLQKG